jgi:glycosyltransferase involved in cell wall biosynthesis
MSHTLGEKISVCLLTYNHAHLIESTLRSILDQSITGYEIVISDDCSTDGTWELLQEWAAQDSRIKLVQTPYNMGMSGNGNYAVKQSDRPYIALLHHDDIYRPDLLEKWAEVLDRRPRVSFVFNRYGVYGNDFVYSETMPGESFSGRWFLANFLFPRWGCAVRGTAMVRRAAWQEVGGLREQFGLLGDIDLWMRLARNWDVGYVDEPIIHVRQERPEDYPQDYKGEGWSWRRQKILYEIHATNRLEVYDLKNILDRCLWWQFRWRLSSETAKWLLYGVLRKRMDMISNSGQSVTDYDLFPVRFLRLILRAL